MQLAYVSVDIPSTLCKETKSMKEKLKRLCDQSRETLPYMVVCILWHVDVSTKIVSYISTHTFLDWFLMKFKILSLVSFQRLRLTCVYVSFPNCTQIILLPKDTELFCISRTVL
jgi:hypothetical protein